MIFGTFDIFHKGHQDFIRQAREFGEYLIVIIARDKNVLKIKGSLPRNNERERQNIIVKNKLADEVILGNINNKYKIIQDNQPNLICLGYDQKVSKKELQEKLIEFNLNNTKFIRLKSFFPEIYKSSKLKK